MAIHGECMAQGKIVLEALVLINNIFLNVSLFKKKKNGSIKELLLVRRQEVK